MQKLKFFHPEPKHVYLIPDKGKPKYIHQYGGTACKTVEITEPIDLGIVDCKYISPSWWYLRVTNTDNHNEWFAEREKKYIDIIKEEEKTHKSFETITAVYDKYYKWMMKKKKRRLYAGEMIGEIEQKVKTNFPVKQLNTLYLRLDYRTRIHSKIVQSPIVEAYIPVYFMYDTDIWLNDGYIIWQNSD